MKITLPPASKVRKDKKEKKPNMTKIAATFINGKLKKAIANAEENSVNEQIPFEAYEDSKTFYAECQRLLKPLGYKSSESHDGGGMYSTLCVEW
jgi:hypothetical protein